jgi:hypothetical protein
MDVVVAAKSKRTMNRGHVPESGLAKVEPTAKPVSLAPLSVMEALRGLLATEPPRSGGRPQAQETMPIRSRRQK